MCLSFDVDAPSQGLIGLLENSINKTTWPLIRNSASPEQKSHCHHAKLRNPRRSNSQVPTPRLLSWKTASLYFKDTTPRASDSTPRGYFSHESVPDGRVKDSGDKTNDAGNSGQKTDWPGEM
uniref:Uncharacterized protein n=1 Tax=Steinernema glaseri TaxID=37863 RepID=A0A1I7Z751_9BILA